MVKDYKKLKVWQRSFGLAKEIYVVTKGFPEDEKFGLTSQIRRAAVSIPSNIAEGASRGSTKEFVRFLYIAVGSAAEIETQLLLVEEIALIDRSTVDLIFVGFDSPPLGAVSSDKRPDTPLLAAGRLH